MSSRVCSQCGCSDIDIDSARGDAVCTGCGSVLEDQIIVSEIQFQENVGGVSSMVGQFVSTDGPKSLSLGGTFRGGMQKESRTITLQNGKKRIQQLAGQMKLNQMCVDRAFNFFKMAVSRRITRGRKTPHVVAACLYLVCRTERTPHMLLDFSDVLQVNVYTLGRTYTCLAKELCINMPEIDPCLYIPRFAHALEFGEKTHEVSMTAMRLVQRMKRDWMHTGRRPSGLCGAALLVAARIHDFSRSVKEIIKVVKVCQTTLKKRLVEFEDTPSSQLTIEEFQTIDLEEEHDPPSFTEGKRKLAIAKKHQEQSQEQIDEVSRLQEEIEETLRKQKPRGIWAAYSKTTDDSFSIDSDASRFSDIIDPEASCDSGKNTSLTVSLESSPADSSFKLESKLETNSSETAKNLYRTDNDHEVNIETDDPSNFRNNELMNDQETNILVVEPLLGDTLTDLTKETSAINGFDGSDNISAITTEMIVGSEELVTSEVDSLKLPVKEALSVPSSVELGVNDIVSDILKEGSDNSNDGQNAEELDLEGLDDAELDKFILTENEVSVKTRIWMAENADYLKAQKEKEERLAKEKEEEAKKAPEKRKRVHKKKPKAPYQEAQTAQEAIQKILQEKRISSKINYDVLNDLTFNSFTAKSASNKGDNTAETGLGGPTVSTVGPIIENRTTLGSRLKKASVGFSPLLEEPPKKQPKLLPFLHEAQTSKQEEVVVESGPVQYLQKDEGYEEEDEIDDYDEEEVTHLSAAQLLGHTGTEEDYYEDME